jgi:hypothetical protein
VSHLGSLAIVFLFVDVTVKILLHTLRFMYNEQYILVPLFGTRLFTVYRLLKLLTI